MMTRSGHKDLGRRQLAVSLAKITEPTGLSLSAEYLLGSICYVTHLRLS